MAAEPKRQNLRMARDSGHSLKRLVMRRTEALKMALMIIRNDAMGRQHNCPQAFNTRMRWCEELEVEAGLREPHNDQAQRPPATDSR